MRLQGTEKRQIVRIIVKHMLLETPYGRIISFPCSSPFYLDNSEARAMASIRFVRKYVRISESLTS